MSTEIESMARGAREASRRIATLDTAAKNRVLWSLARAIDAERTSILAANAADMDAARTATPPLPHAKQRRLELTNPGLTQFIRSLEHVVTLPDPVQQVTRDERVASGLRVRKVRAPLGVIAMIYEARPGVTIEAFSLCFKAGNACILKGGREALHSNRVLCGLARGTLREHGVPETAVALVETSNRERIRELLSLDKLIDLVIPRGGKELIEFVHANSRIPTVQHFEGVCHIFVDKSADLDQAERICVTAKTSAPATCNAVECVLVHGAIAGEFVPRLVRAYREAGVEVRGDGEVCRLGDGAKPAVEGDWGREFLDLFVAMRVVPGLDAAIEHIARYSSSHTEAILTCDEAAAARFTSEVQSSCVLVNASTRFNDGYSLGLGAEIGISTSRIHAYGPMGLEELTTQRWIVHGDGHTR